MTIPVFDPEAFTGSVLDALGRHGEVPPRQREIATALIRHLHAFCRETDLQMPELLAACDFLARAGQTCSETRQEFILLADILGVESLVCSQSQKAVEGETEAAVLGPFYRTGSPEYAAGGTILQQERSDCATVLFEGQVRDLAGDPISGALIEIWEDAPNGLYEHQDDAQPDHNLRGSFRTDGEGRYAIRCIRPAPYPIPTDETAGELIRYLGLHPMRPAHVHFKLSHPECRTLVTQIFDAESAHLDGDAVFGVKDSLIVTFKPAPRDAGTDLYLAHDFVLART